MYYNGVLEISYNISSSLIFHISLSLDFISISLSLSFLSSALRLIPLTRISRHLRHQPHHFQRFSHVVERIPSLAVTLGDPYLNTDAGTMSPFEHGEVFVLDDGGEVDLDLGNYERFLDIKLTHDNNITTGKMYQSVIEKERRRDYLGKTVQVVAHITDAIQEWIERVAKIPVDRKEGPADVCVIKLGGTIGDIESMPFIEALLEPYLCSLIC
ncbi:uncharacterized protein LOC108326198 [Vigna angularis]|uniref:uncharacterized protein LOC108326198 n=1 Tax=Phaseolus angularis TaxID=3914 RepID=UPI0022B5BE9B|nr:uncharacterized protein LOC108326198 [Vigna angularis]